MTQEAGPWQNLEHKARPEKPSHEVGPVTFPATGIQPEKSGRRILRAEKNQHKEECKILSARGKDSAGLAVVSGNRPLQLRPVAVIPINSGDLKILEFHHCP